MVWTLEFSSHALKQLKKLDKRVAGQILEILETRIAKGRDPRRFGKALTGEFKGLWRYRIGDYRVICELKDKELVILTIAIGHRREVYK